VRSFRRCDTDHFPVVAVAGESLSVSKREIQFDVKFDLSKLIMWYGENSFRSKSRT